MKALARRDGISSVNRYVQTSTIPWLFGYGLPGRCDRWSFACRGKGHSTAEAVTATRSAHAFSTAMPLLRIVSPPPRSEDP